MAVYDMRTRGAANASDWINTNKARNLERRAMLAKLLNNDRQMQSEDAERRAINRMFGVSGSGPVSPLEKQMAALLFQGQNPSPAEQARIEYWKARQSSLLNDGAFNYSGDYGAGPSESTLGKAVTAGTAPSTAPSQSQQESPLLTLHREVQQEMAVEPQKQTSRGTGVTSRKKAARMQKAASYIARGFREGGLTGDPATDKEYLDAYGVDLAPDELEKVARYYQEKVNKK